MQDETTTIYLIRHAKTQQSKLTPADLWELSPLGEEQALALISDLSSFGIGQVFTSPFKKAIQTITPFCHQQGLHNTIIDGLRERKVSNDYIEDFNAVIQKSWTDFNFSPPNGETNFSAQMRIKNVLERIVKEQFGKTVAICSHGQVIALFLNYLDKNFGFDDWKKMEMPSVYKIVWTKNKFEWMR